MAWARGIRASGNSDKLDRLLRGDGERQCFRIGQTHIFARENYDAARDEPKVFAGMQHFGQPVDGAFSSEARMLLMKALIVS